jgi:hypothetical protein
MRRITMLILAAAAIAGGGVTLRTMFLDAETTGAEGAGPSNLQRDGRDTQPVTVVVYDEGAPVSERWVVFHDRDGNVVSRIESGPDGKASAPVPPGGMITVAHGESLQHLVSFLDVEPGDEIVVGDTGKSSPVPHQLGAARLLLPGPYAAAARYEVSLGVGQTDVDPTTPTSLPVLERFLADDGNFKTVAEALADDGQPLAYAFAWGSWTAAGTTTADATTDVPLGPWKKDFRSFEIALGDPPEGASSVEGRLSIFSKDDDRFDRPLRRASLGEAREEATALVFGVPPQLGSEALYRLDVTCADSPDKLVLVQRREQLEPRVAVDLGRALLPRVSDVVADVTSASARPTIRWSVAGDPKRRGEADAIIVRASWPETREHVWTLVMPPTTDPTIRLPALPPELSSWQPDGRPLTAAAALVEASFYDGYRSVRHKGIERLGKLPKRKDGETRIRYSVSGALDL